MANPIAFRPGQVTFWTFIYFLLLAPIIYVHETVPHAPEKTQEFGLDLEEAWSDLTTLTQAPHPHNSRQNDVVRSWLLTRLSDIQKENGANDSMIIFDDNLSNVTWVEEDSNLRPIKDPDSRAKRVATYFEGNNVVVYIRGRDDPPGSWWEDVDVDSPTDNIIGNGGVLINAHFDSVPTSLGATDDGVGVASILQLIKYFTVSQNRPRRGIVALLNNAEENGLLGARAFARHQLMPFCQVFVNLEGAGAGGRAVLFRTTDAGVTAAYKGSPHPFGAVVASDSFELGLIKSDTDYSVFSKKYGMRGLDIAFYRPRSRYHTQDDDARHTSVDSLWHMLSKALHTVKNLSDGDQNKADESRNDGIWFDLLGHVFVVIPMNNVFAWSVTLLVAAPLLLILVSFILAKLDKYYFFASKKVAYEEALLEPVLIRGKRGILRFPFALAIASALVIASAFLLTEFNPFVVYSYGYTVWSMMLSLFYFSFWAIVTAANALRPSALHRGYAILWLFTMFWIVLIGATVLLHQFHIASGYPFVFLGSAISICALTTLLEQLALPKKTTFARRVHDDHETRDFENITDDDHEAQPQEPDETSPLVGGTNDEQADESDPTAEGIHQEEPNETSPLVGGSKIHQRTFGAVYRRSVASAKTRVTPSTVGTSRSKPYGNEQLWSGRLPSTLWFLQFLLLAPFLPLIGGLGLALASSLSQTSADGGNPLLAYLLIAGFSILLVLPITPFLHRVRHIFPTLLLGVFVISLTFNMVIFPFNETSRYKVYLSQDVDIETGESVVHYAGVEEYIRQAVAVLPSAMGKKVVCQPKTHGLYGLNLCTYNGSKVMPTIGGKPHDEWIHFSSSRNGTKAQLTIDGYETRKCAIRFADPISSFEIQDGDAVTAEADSIVLYRRNWTKPWDVEVTWEDTTTSRVEVSCEWAPSDSPLLKEAALYLPGWVTFSLLDKSIILANQSYLV